MRGNRREFMRWELGNQMMEHPTASVVGALVVGGISAAFGILAGPGTVVAMAVLGIIIGAPIGAEVAESAPHMRLQLRHRHR